jgi:hypothetical protein
MTRELVEDIDCQRTLNVTPAGYEVTMRITKSHWHGDTHVNEVFTVKTFTPHTTLAIEKVETEVLQNVA